MTAPRDPADRDARLLLGTAAWCGLNLAFVVAAGLSLLGRTDPLGFVAMTGVDAVATLVVLSVGLRTSRPWATVVATLASASLIALHLWAAAAASAAC